MRRRFTVLMAVLLVVGLAAPSAFADIVIGHPAALSGKYAKAAEQAVGGVNAAVNWVNDTRGGVMVDGKKQMIKYKVYDCESKK